MASSGNGTALSSAVAPGRCLLIRRLVTAAYWLGNGYQTYPPSVHPTGREHQAWRAYRSYRFDWQPTQVTYSMDLEDGQGFRTLVDEVNFDSSRDGTAVRLTLYCGRAKVDDVELI